MSVLQSDYLKNGFFLVHSVDYKTGSQPKSSTTLSGEKNQT